MLPPRIFIVLRRTCVLVPVLVALLGISRAATAQGVDNIEDVEKTLKAFRVLTPANIADLRAANREVALICPDSKLAKIQGVLKELQSMIDAEGQLSASASFSFRDNQASGQSVPDSTNTGKGRQAIEAAIALSRGTYPLQVYLESAVSLTRNQDGEIEEDISSLFLSVDRHVVGTWMEMFGFLSRTSDDFLSIDQRYETGSGVVLNYWSPKLTSSGYEADEGLNPGDDWVACFEAIGAITSGDSTFSAEAARQVLASGSDIVRKINLKQHSILRLAMLVGLMGEVEQASIDTFSVNDRGWRLELRPTVAFHPVDAVWLRADWYLKYAVGGYNEPSSHQAQIEQTLGLFTDIGHDLRTRLELSASVAVKGVNLTLTHERLRDHIPPFATVGDEVALTSDGRPIVASYRRNRTVFKVVIPL